MKIFRNGLVVITVVYHSQEAINDLAKSLCNQTRHPNHWLLINNSPNSSDPIKLQTNFNFTIIQGQEGDGFGKGCNRGLEHLQKQGWNGWVWLLNPDTVFLDRETLEQLQIKLEKLPQKVLLGTAVIDKNGNLESTAGWIDPGLRFRARRVKETFCKINPLAVDWVSGCSLLFRPGIYKSQPRFDPLFPLYYEDMDLCMRLSKEGIPTLWLPSIEITHHRGEGSRTPLARRLRLSSCSYIRFLQRYRPGWVLWLRSIRLLIKALLELPLSPSRSCAILQGWIDACRNPIK